MKLSNFFRTLDRMKKYDYMRTSQFYKNAKRYERKYKRANSKEEKDSIKEQLEALIEQNPSRKNVKEFKKFAGKQIETVNQKYGGGKSIINEENYSKYIDFIDKVSTSFGNYFYETEKALKTFNKVVVIGGKSVETAVKEFIK